MEGSANRPRKQTKEVMERAEFRAEFKAKFEKETEDSTGCYKKKEK